MIRYSLSCERDHEFDGWFRSADDFDTQKKRGLISCPECGSAHVDKALMAPSVSTSRGKDKIALTMGEQQREMMARLRELATAVRANAEDVGDRFAEEARKIHFGESEERGIYGEASVEEVKELLDDGIGIMPLPTIPDDHN